MEYQVPHTYYTYVMRQTNTTRYTYVMRLTTTCYTYVMRQTNTTYYTYVMRQTNTTCYTYVMRQTNTTYYTHVMRQTNTIPGILYVCYATDVYDKPCLHVFQGNKVAREHFGHQTVQKNAETVNRTKILTRYRLVPACRPNSFSGQSPHRS